MNQFNSIGITQIIICMAVITMSSVITISFGIFLPHYITALKTDVETLSLAISIVLIVVGLASPFVGRLLDTWTVRSLLAGGGVFMVLGFVGVSMANSATTLLFGYFLLGLGYSAFAPLVTVKHVSDWFPQRLGLATSLITLPIGIIMFPSLTQWLVTELDWRQTLQIYAAVTMVIMASLILLKSPPKLINDENGHQSHLSSDTQSAPLSSKSIYKTLLRSKLFWFGIIGFCVFMAGPLSIMTHFVVVVQTKGLTTETAVNLLSTMGVAALIGAPFFGYLCDRFGPRFGYIISALFQGCALFQLTGSPSELQLTITIIIIGLFLPSSYVFFAAFVAKVIGAKNFGTGFGLATLVAAVVGAFPPAIAGAVYGGSSSYDGFFIPLAVLTLLTGFIAWWLGNPTEVKYPSHAHPS